MRTEKEVKDEIDRIDWYLKGSKPHTFGLTTENQEKEMYKIRFALRWVLDNSDRKE